MEPAFSQLSSPSQPQQGPAVGCGSAAASCTARGLHALVAKPSSLVKAAWRDGPEMKHIPLSLGLYLQKRRGKFICAGVKPCSSSPPIAIRSKVSSSGKAGFQGMLLVPGAKGTLQIRQQMGLCCSQGEVRCRAHFILLALSCPGLSLARGMGEAHGKGATAGVSQEPFHLPRHILHVLLCKEQERLWQAPDTALGQRAAGAALELAAEHSLCRAPQLGKTAATAGLGRTENITRVGFAAPQQRPSFCPGNLSYKPQLENGKKKWKYETMA